MWLGRTFFKALFELYLRPGVPLGEGLTIDQERWQEREGCAHAAALTLAWSIPAALRGDEQRPTASTTAWLWCVYHSAGLHQLLLAAPYLCLVKEGFSGAFSQKKKCFPFLHHRWQRPGVWCLPGNFFFWRIFSSQESSWRDPFEFPCPSLTCHVPNMIKTLSSLPEWQHETSGTWQWCRRMQGGKTRERTTKVSGSFAFQVAAFPSPSDHCRAFWQLQTAR